MSGPTTVIFTAEPATVLLAAAAIRAAEAVQAGYQEAARLHDEHATRQAENHNTQRTARAAGQKIQAVAVNRAEQRYSHLCQLAAPFAATAALRATPIQPPLDTSPLNIATYLKQLEAQCFALEKALCERLGEGDSSLTEQGISTAVLVDEQEMSPSPESRTPSAAHAVTTRLLARLAILGPLPEGIEILKHEIAVCSAVDRRALLEIELRRALQLYEEQATHEASAVILEQSLKDLGYQVAPVSDTLFVEGGVVHFRRAAWGDYQIRLRLNAKESSANFNVVRAVDAGHNERSVLDHLAEDRWCAEFPALLDALAKRGLHLEVTRRLLAGELPVQFVDRDKLPRFANEETAAGAALRHKEIP